MAESNETQNPNPQNPTPAPSAETKNTGNEQAGEHMIPKSRFDEVNNGFKELKKQLDALTAEKTQKEQELAERDRKAKEEQGKFQELYETAAKDLDKFKGESKTAATRVQQLEAVINGLLEAKLEGVPEEFRDLIPANLTPELRLEWLAAAEKKGLFGAKKKETPVGESTNPAGKAAGDLNSMSPIQLLRAAYGPKQ
jgi:ribonucleoside-triphosphate reductase